LSKPRLSLSDRLLDERLSGFPCKAKSVNRSHQITNDKHTSFLPKFLFNILDGLRNPFKPKVTAYVAEVRRSPFLTSPRPNPIGPCGLLAQEEQTRFTKAQFEEQLLGEITSANISCELTEDSTLRESYYLVYAGPQVLGFPRQSNSASICTTCQLHIKCHI
jgi:hypothetical protein